MNKLSQLPNIGKILSDKLQITGINSVDELKQIGAEDAFIRLCTIDQSSCINTLYALEGAIQEIRWHQISKERKKELLEFFHKCQSMQ